MAGRVIAARAALFGACAVLLAAPAVLGQDPVLIERGRAAYTDSGCYGCHTIGKTGTPIGPDLTAIGARYGREFFQAWLADPANVRAHARMPQLELSESQLDAIAVFLSSLR
jgi:cbb3-type cytochrome oxidase cytochrome c subunit